MLISFSFLGMYGARNYCTFNANVYPMMDFEYYRTNLTELNKWRKTKTDANLNEADTRFFLIDELFFKCLGWEKDDVKHEQHQDSEYADYTFYLSGRRTAIVEAKRESITFEIPAGFTSRPEYKLSSLMKDNPEISKAINQTITYCNSRGVEIGIVANGHQLVAFLAHRNDGISPLDGKAIVFSSISAMEKNFLFLWQMLSKPGIAEKRLPNFLLESDLAVLPYKLSSKIANYPKVARRNELQTDLQIVSEVILENVNNAEDVIDDFLKETYCQSGALSQYALVSKSILDNRYSLLFEHNTEGPTVKDAVTKKGISPEVFADSLTSRPILLLGDVGAGKSMFINYFLRIEANETIKKSFTIYVDLGSKAALASNLNDFFLDEVIRLFQEKHDIDFYENNFVRGVYHGELMKFAKGIYGGLKTSDPSAFLNKEIEFLAAKIDNKSEHIRACLAHITKGWKRQIVIIMDNVDQRNEDIQEQAFLISNEIASNWSVTVFITLRPSTFYKSKKEGTLTGYHPKAFTIYPPRIHEVIKKRLDFALKIASGQIQSHALSTVFQVNLQTLSQFLEILVFSFKNNRELIEFIDNICYGNVRKAIEYLAIFIGSGHIDTRKILEMDSENMLQGNRYLISLHEFIRAIIFREYEYYFPDRTDIVNVMDVSQEAKEHFILPIILDHLLRHSTVSEGFIEIIDIVDYLQDEGYKFSQIEFAILRGIYKGLLETEARKLLNVGDSLPKAIRITTTGAYHLQKLINMFTYLDAIVVDTPIIDEFYREKIVDSNAIHIRLERASIFCDYLDSSWQNAAFKKVGFDWMLVSSQIRGEIQRISSSLTRRY